MCSVKYNVRHISANRNKFWLMKNSSKKKKKKIAKYKKWIMLVAETYYYLTKKRCLEDLKYSALFVLLLTNF